MCEKFTICIWYNIWYQPYAYGTEHLLLYYLWLLRGLYTIDFMYKIWNLLESWLDLYDLI